MLQSRAYCPVKLVPEYSNSLLVSCLDSENDRRPAGFRLSQITAPLASEMAESPLELSQLDQIASFECTETGEVRAPTEDCVI